MSDQAPAFGVNQPAPTAVVPPLQPAGSLGGTPAAASTAVPMPEPRTQTPSDMPAGAMPAAVQNMDLASPSLGELPAPQMSEPAPAGTEEMPAGEMPFDQG